jgi:hypothetical protein
VTRWLGLAARAGVSLGVALLSLAFLRWGPVYDEPPLDVRAFPLAAWVFLLALLAAATGRGLARRPLRPLVLLLGGTCGALALVVALRPAAGLSGAVRSPQSALGVVPEGPIDLVGDDLAALPRTHREFVAWEGEFRAPETGFYRFWGGGSGSLHVLADRDVVLDGSLPAGSAPVYLTEGPHALAVELSFAGPPGHFRLGWVRPGGRCEVIPERYLGRAAPAVFWILTDVLCLLVGLLAGLLAWRAPWGLPRRLPLPRPVTGAEILASTLGLGAVVLVMSFPLVLHLASTGPVDRADGRLNAWILSWDVHALLTRPLRLFDAPIFHPLPDALAFSENLLLPAIVAAPATLLGGPVLGYNVALLLCLVGSGLGTYLLVRRVTRDSFAAFVAAALFAAGAHRWFRLAHLHAQATTFLPFCLWAFDRFWETRSLKRALGVGAFLFLQGMSSVYLGVITATTLGVAVLCALVGGLGCRALLRLAGGLLLGVVALVPLVAPYLRMRAFEGREWSFEEVSRSATTLESYAASATRLWGPLTERHADDERTREPIFPGLVPLLLGCAGLSVAPRRFLVVGLAASTLAVLISLGAATPVCGFLYAHVFLFRGIRVLNRFSLVPVLALSVLSGLAVAGRRFARPVALVLGLVEASYLPLGFGSYSPPGAAARFLAGRPGAVLWLPLGEDDSAVMLEGLAHFRPLVNGDSGFVPLSYRREKELFEDGVGPEGARFLRAVGVTDIVARRDYGLPVRGHFAEDLVLSLPAGDEARVVEEGLPGPTLWGPGGATLDLGAPRDVGRVSFELGDGAWKARPTLSVSLDGVSWTRVAGEASLADAVLSLTRDPRGARGEVRFGPVRARFVRLDPALPVSPGLLGWGP